MCFSPGMSLGMGIGTLAVAGLLYAKGKPARCYTILVYFGLMEFLQLAQYAVADKCGNPINQALTMAAFVHTAFQPFVVNLYFLHGQVRVSVSCEPFGMIYRHFRRWRRTKSSALAFGFTYVNVTWIALYDKQQSAAALSTHRTCSTRHA